jgi:hypothetical protein
MPGEKEDLLENNALTALKTSMMTKEATLLIDKGTTMTEMHPHMDLRSPVPTHRPHNLTLRSATTRCLSMTSLKKDATLKSQTLRVTNTKSRGR